MNNKRLTIPIKIISFFLVLLGFQACGGHEKNNGGIAEYGTPTAQYRIKGTVVVKKDKMPIKGIRVVVGVKYGESQEEIGGLDTLITNNKGEFALVAYSYIGKDLIVIAEDIDGVENLGEFKTKEIVDMKFAQIEAGSGWNKGTFSTDLGEVDLEEKELVE